MPPGARPPPSSERAGGGLAVGEGGGVVEEQGRERPHFGGVAEGAYHQLPGVAPGSVTETFAALRFTFDNWRWGGTPFYVRTGKRLPKRVTEIAIQFKAVPQELFGTATGDADANLLVIRIQPDEGIMLRFAAKVPGLGVDVRPVNMDFGYGASFGGDVPEAYETLILDALLGDASLFICLCVCGCTNA